MRKIRLFLVKSEMFNDFYTTYYQNQKPDPKKIAKYLVRKSISGDTSKIDSTFTENLAYFFPIKAIK